MSSARTCLTSLAVAIAIAGCGQAPEPAKSAPPAAPPAAPASAPPAASPQAAPAAGASTSAVGGLGNDVTVPPDITDADIPPLPTTPFPAAAPMDIVRAVYVFAARHPEVLNQVPCFCGCENRGHRHNDDCFVKARDAQERPTEWELHGVG